MNKRTYTYIFAILYAVSCFLIISSGMSSVNAATRSIKHGDTVTINLGDSVKVDAGNVPNNSTGNFGNTYVKFKASKTGWLKVFSQNDYWGYVQLLNENKSPVFATQELISEKYDPYKENWSVNFEVKSGKVYYLRLSSHSFYLGDNVYEIGTDKYDITTSFKVVKDVGGKSKKKAKIIKRGKKVTGLLPSGKKTARWYKIKLKKNQKLKIYMSFYGSGKSYFLIKPNKGKSIERTIYDNNKALSWDHRVNNSLKIIKTQNKLKKGTVVYVKIYNKNKTDSGVYTLKWK